MVALPQDHRPRPKEEGLNNKLNHKIRVLYGSVAVTMRKRGSWASLKWSINNHSQYSLPAVAHTPKQWAQHLQYTRSINSKPCPPFYSLKEACLNDTPLSGLGSPYLPLNISTGCIFEAIRHLYTSSQSRVHKGRHTAQDEAFRTPSLCPLAGHRQPLPSTPVGLLRWVPSLPCARRP